MTLSLLEVRVPVRSNYSGCVTIETTSQITIETVIASSVMIAISLIAVLPKWASCPVVSSLLFV